MYDSEKGKNAIARHNVCIMLKTSQLIKYLLDNVSGGRCAEDGAPSEP